MKVELLHNHETYSCNAYLVRGDWNAISDVNTLIDVGADDYVLSRLPFISTGVGKKPVEMVILTHNHFDHAGGLRRVIEKYNPEVCAFSKSEGVTRLLDDGEYLKIGDRAFEVIPVTAHSNDSICLYSSDDKTLFSGDTPLNIKSPGGTYPLSFINSLERLVSLDIEIIYSGHDDPVTHGAKAMIANTLLNVKKSSLVSD
jgi:glyoxylase-like metal-dependent hydrolase (beta-lactamase superfamily II)